MDNNKLKNLLTEAENPKLEFKSSWYCGDDKLDDKGWGEFLKDIIALANGNLGYIGRTGYLIIGASDSDPELNNPRDVFHIDNIGMLANLQDLRQITLRKLRETCSPSLSDIKIYFINLEENKNLLVFEIPSPIDLLKLDRDINTRGLRFKKGTVLIRIGQDIGVADPTEISSLKKEFTNQTNSYAKGNKKVLHNLPQPDYVNFVGRKDELERLRNLLHPQDRVWTVVIDGIGGIGKSALALEIAHRYLNEYEFLPPAERFEAIIWVSAKTSSLTVEGIQTRYQITNTISDIYQEIAVVFQKDEIYRNNLDEQNILIKRALIQLRTLLIIDNFETIDDKRVNSFIRELPVPTKCIVTTRYRIDIAEPIRLSAMSRDDAIALIKQECNKKSVRLSDNQAELLYKRTAGVPLALVWSIAQISYHGFDIEKVLKSLGNAKGDIARFCFESAIQQIQNKSPYKLLVCISLALNPLMMEIGRDAIGHIADFSELDCDEGLAILERLSLINRKVSQASYFSILPLVKEYIFSRAINLKPEELELIITRISQIYAPSGAYAIEQVKHVFEDGALAPLKCKITSIVVNQMWQWDSYYDEQGVYYCVAALEKLATDEAVKNIKDVAHGTVSYQSPYVYLDVVHSLARLERLTDLIELVLSDRQITNSVIDVLCEFKAPKLISEIDKFLEREMEGKKIIFLQQLKEQVSSRYLLSNNPSDGVA